MEREAPRLSRRADNLSAKVALLLGQSPMATLRFAWRLLNARMNLRAATSVGKYVKLVGRMRVENAGRLIVGDRVLIHSHVAKTELVALQGAELKIGSGAFINYGAEICAHKYIEIGEECRIGTHCIIMDNDFHTVELSRRDAVPPSADVVLEPHVWIGNRVTILKGVRIGYGSIVAAGSVVTRSIPPMSIAGGVPAKVIRPLEGGARVSEMFENGQEHRSALKAPAVI